MGVPAQLSIPKLQFLKLGGSLITDKNQPHSPRLEVLSRLAGEIGDAYEHNPSLRLILGHGSGSFGHVPAKRYGTRVGVRTAEEWRGFVEVWHEAFALNCIVVDTLISAGLPVINFSPLSSIIALDGNVASWNLAPIREAIKAGLIPVVHGDVVFDKERGGTILSTEDLFSYMAGKLKPGRILLAGLEPGIWADYPVCTQIVEEITPKNWLEVAPKVSGSAAVDVTGGMASKVRQSLEWVHNLKKLEVFIFSGEIPGAVERALTGARLGTAIHS